MRAQQRAILAALRGRAFDLKSSVFTQREAIELVNRLCEDLDVEPCLTRGSFQGYVAEGLVTPARPRDGRNYLLSTIDILRLTALAILVPRGVRSSVAGQVASMIESALRDGGFERWAHPRADELDARDLIVLRLEADGWTPVTARSEKALRLALSAGPAVLVLNAAVVGCFVISAASELWNKKAARLLARQGGRNA